MLCFFSFFLFSLFLHVVSFLFHIFVYSVSFGTLGLNPIPPFFYFFIFNARAGSWPGGTAERRRSGWGFFCFLVEMRCLRETTGGVQLLWCNIRQSNVF